MKRIFISTALMLSSVLGYAQEVTVAEPEFIGSYCILTSDSTYDILPKENGQIKKHQTKIGKFSKIAGAVGDISIAGGMLGITTGGISSGVKAIGTGVSVSATADAVNTLAGAEGYDIAFEGGQSSYKIKNSDNDVRLIIKTENNNNDPMGIYRIVRFKESKKDRRIQWFEFSPSLLGNKDAKKKGFLSFTAHKYGESSYMVTIPASELEPGEYGIFFMSIISSVEIPVGTFSVTK